MYQYLSFWGHQAWRLCDRFIPLWRDSHKDFALSLHVESAAYAIVGNLHAVGSFVGDGREVVFSELSFTPEESPFVPTPLLPDNNGFDVCMFTATIKRIFEQRIVSCAPDVPVPPENPFVVTDSTYMWIASQLAHALCGWGSIAWTFRCPEMGIIDCDTCSPAGTCLLSDYTAMVSASGVFGKHHGKLFFRLDSFNINFSYKGVSGVPSTFDFDKFFNYLCLAVKKYCGNHINISDSYGGRC